jgi:DNA-binding LytR/AlgR family response regulator
MEWLKITTNSEIIRIPTDEIIFIKGDGNYSDIFLANGKKENVISQLHDLMDKLTALNYSPFYRVGKSLIINRDYIFKVNPGLQRIILSNSQLEKDILIKASKDALKNLKEKLETEEEEELTLEKEGGNS